MFVESLHSYIIKSCLRLLSAHARGYNICTCNCTTTSIILFTKRGVHYIQYFKVGFFTVQKFILILLNSRIGIGTVCILYKSHVKNTNRSAYIFENYYYFSPQEQRESLHKKEKVFLFFFCSLLH